MMPNNIIDKNTNTNDTCSIFDIQAKSIALLKGDSCPIETINNITCLKSISSTHRSENPFIESYPPSLRSETNKLEVKGFQEEALEIKEDDQSNHEKERQSFNRRNYLRMSTSLFMEKIYLKGTKSECQSDIKDCEFIYSLNKFHPFSFMTGNKNFGFDKQKKLWYPSPKFIEQDLILQKPNLAKDEILKGMIISDEKGWVLVDKFIKKKFRGIISDMIAQLIKVAFGHKISLNVKLFEPKSFLQRLTEYWLYLPTYLPRAVNPFISSLERMKLIMTFAISGLYLPTKQLKPFNPLIDETFQGTFDSDSQTQVYAEQISNYPTLSRFYVKDPKFIMSGYVDWSMETESWGSKITVFSKGYTKIDFIEINESIIYMLPSAKILNATSENNRGSYFNNVMVFNDYKNKLKGIVLFGRDSKVIHNFNGCIIEYKFNKEELEKFDYDKEKELCGKLKFNYDTNHAHDKRGGRYKIVCKVEGSWLGNLLLNGEEYWNINTYVPHWIKPSKRCWPSDWRFREDLIWLYRSFYCSKNEQEAERFEQIAQNWKLLIEKLQREEREYKAKQNLKRKKNN